jgi:hypothetical protein
MLDQKELEMARISEKRETRIQALLPKSTVTMVDDCMFYATRNFFRYVAGSKHITGDCDVEAMDKSWRHHVPTIIWLIFAPQRFVVVMPYPVTWDNEDTQIPEEQLQTILDRIERALKERCKNYKIVFQGREDARRIS